MLVASLFGPSTFSPSRKASSHEKKRIPFARYVYIYIYVSNIYSLPSNPEQDICHHIRERPGGRRGPQASFLSHLLGLSAGRRQVRNRRKKQQVCQFMELTLVFFGHAWWNVCDFNNFHLPFKIGSCMYEQNQMIRSGVQAGGPGPIIVLFQTQLGYLQCG